MARIGTAAPRRGYRQENPWLRRLLICASLLFTLLMLVSPLAAILVQALGLGWDRMAAAMTDPYTVKAMKLTFLTGSISVLANTLFGLCAAWALTRFSFRGQGLIITLIDLPFAISPIIAGLVFILTYGRLGWAKPILDHFDLRIVFATPGMIMATVFVTLPFVAREIIPVLTARGCDEERAAVLMGAGFFRVFFTVTLPHIRWALAYSVILCAARAMGEFGAVSVVSGHLRGKTITLPLHVEILYNEHHYNEAFAVSAILVVTSVIILAARCLVERLSGRESRGVR